MRFSKTKILTALIIAIFSLLIGLGLAKATIFDNMKYLFLWGIIAFITIIIGIFETTFKKRISKISGNVLITLTIAFIVSLPIRKHYWNERRHKSEIAINRLDSFLTQNGNYPKSLTELKLDLDLSDLYYISDSLGRNFYISYDIDGWHSERYNSKERIWTGGD